MVHIWRLVLGLLLGHVALSFLLQMAFGRLERLLVEIDQPLGCLHLLSHFHSLFPLLVLLFANLLGSAKSCGLPRVECRLGSAKFRSPSIFRKRYHQYSSNLHLANRASSYVM